MNTYGMFYTTEQMAAVRRKHESEVAALRAEVERLRGELRDTHLIGQAFVDRIAKQRTERDALLAVVRAVARFDHDDSYDGAYKCHWCDLMFDDRQEEHAGDCQVSIARALVAAHDAATGASATGQQVVLRGSISDECKRGEHAKCKGWTDKGACVCGCGHTKPL